MTCKTLIIKLLNNKERMRTYTVRNILL